RFAPSLGFPDFGFDLFRRTHRTGTPRALDMAGRALGNLPASTKIGVTTWTGHDVYRPNRIVSAQTQSGSQSLLVPATLATCLFDASELPVRRIEIDLVHWGPHTAGAQPIAFTLWGLSDSERVARGDLQLTLQNYQHVLTVAVSGDRLDGFQTRLSDGGPVGF